MALFAKADDPPREEEGALAYVLWIAREWHGIKNARPELALGQDLHIVGDDAGDFICKLEERFGEWVWQWPWQRFVDLNEGLGLAFPFLLIWQLATWPLRGSFHYPENRQRLTLAHIAEVLERGEWFEPEFTR